MLKQQEHEKAANEEALKLLEQKKIKLNYDQ